ncbi:hypothetical protein [Bowmanella dokdonensis]|uniref:Uncharacterized protein n=1 Tax=Bowmanella dokdonensis TaxID=751969 RepID=A0A939ISJ3_9ALTE|nr:hypothetical protein [Bowmanella dokdonensis]MBN7826787.1 hypothetical protein [Bowmanella dokdonensis]
MSRYVAQLFNRGEAVSARYAELAKVTPLLGLLRTEDDEPRFWLHASQALQRLLLVGCKEGLAADYLNQPIQVAGVRDKLQQLINQGTQQILVRIGAVNPNMPATPRRGLKRLIHWLT